MKIIICKNRKMFLVNDFNYRLFCNIYNIFDVYIVRLKEINLFVKLPYKSIIKIKK